MNRELSDVQAGFIKGRGTRDQIANICWITEKAREFQKTYFPGKYPAVGCHFLYQGIFLTQRLNLGLLHCTQILYHLSHQGSPVIKPWGRKVRVDLN